MEIREVKNTVGKLSKNKVFLVGVLAVVGLAFYQIVKGGGTLSNDGGLAPPSGVSGYPEVGENADTVINTINGQIDNYNKDITDKINTLGEYIDSVKSEITSNINDKYSNIQTEFGQVGDTIKNQIDSQFQSTNNYLGEGFDRLNNVNNALGNNILDSINNGLLNLGDKVDSGSQSIWDKIESSNDKTNNFLDSISSSIKDNNDNIKDYIDKNNNSLNNRFDQVQSQIEETKDYLSDREAQLSESINEWGDRLYYGGKK